MEENKKFDLLSEKLKDSKRLFSELIENEKKLKLSSDKKVLVEPEKTDKVLDDIFLKESSNSFNQVHLDECISKNKKLEVLYENSIKLGNEIRQAMILSSEILSEIELKSKEIEERSGMNLKIQIDTENFIQSQTKFYYILSGGAICCFTLGFFGGYYLRKKIETIGYFVFIVPFIGTKLYIEKKW